MDSKYLRVPQDASDVLCSENEKDRSGRQFSLVSRTNLILLLSVAANAVLALSLIMMLREKPTPTGFGECKQAVCDDYRLTSLSQGRHSQDHMEPILVEYGLQSQKPLG